MESSWQTRLSDRIGTCRLILLISWVVAGAGCRNDDQLARQIQFDQQERRQSQSQQDHLAEAFDLLAQYVELDPTQASRQIAYHLNQWRRDKSFARPPITPLIKTVSGVVPAEQLAARLEGEEFVAADAAHLRNAFLFNRIVRWADHPRSDDPVLADWLEAQAEVMSETAARQLRTAARLFDWTVRNVAYEPTVPTDQAPPPPRMSAGLVFRGAGYRQTDFQSVWHGTGDALQRAAVFTQLCRQAEIPAFLLAQPPSGTAPPAPWAVGVLIDDQIYLFEPELGLHIPGPGSKGIATLAEARTEPSVLRRLNVLGFFDYPLTNTDIGQSIVILNVLPEALSGRMAHLQSALTGERRMTVYVDADAIATRADEVAGIAGARLSHLPLLAEIYQQDLQAGMERDPILAFWYQSQWAIMDAANPTARQLSLARWRHLTGDFSGDEIENRAGARELYLAQRAPEFEIADLPIDVELQKAYGVRRSADTTPDQYQMQLRFAQEQMRLGKRTATYWISLIHYEDQNYDAAESWLTKRVLARAHREPRWESAARYNLARSQERLGKLEQAIEIYKTDGEANEHGNRLRARLIDRAVDANEPN